MQGESNQDDRLWAMLSYLLGIPFPLVAPLVIYMMKKDQSRFVAFHSLQSLFICLATAVPSLVLVLIGCALNLTPLGCLAYLLYLLALPLSLAALVFMVIAALKSYSGEWYLVPVVGNMVQQQMDRIASATAGGPGVTQPSPPPSTPEPPASTPPPLSTTPPPASGMPPPPPAGTPEPPPPTIPPPPSPSTPPPPPPADSTE
jgi:uncharacterized Tic20 family protein